jgi:hypothetical protein
MSTLYNKFAAAVNTCQLFAKELDKFKKILADELTEKELVQLTSVLDTFLKESSKLRLLLTTTLVLVDEIRIMEHYQASLS